MRPSLPLSPFRARAAVGGGAAPPGTDPAATSAAAAAVARLQAQVRAAKARAMSVAQIDAVRALADWGAYGGAFLLTHNLFASFFGSVAADAAFSAYQRIGVVRQAKRERAKWDAATAALRAKLDAKGGEEEKEKGKEAEGEEPPAAPPPSA
jgi:hypothetical protein